MWVHNGMINIKDDKASKFEKMSKSIGNVQWAKDLIAEYGGNTIRWILISTHYRAPLNLSNESFTTAQKELGRIETAYRQAQVKLQIADANKSDEVDTTLWQSFLDALNDDLNTPNAISTVFEAVKQLNQSLRTRQMDTDKVSMLLNTVEKMLYVLGIEFEPVVLTTEDKETYRAWREAVKAKNFDVADTYRAKLQAKGIL